jgi:Holliday junction DNA helicase RuvB
MFEGPSGYGKTLLAELVAKSLDANLIYMNSVAIKDEVTFRELFRETAKSERSIIMIDECHMLPKRVKVNMLSLLEHPSILCTPGMLGGNNRIIKREGYITKERLPKGASIIMATTDTGSIEDTVLNRLLRIRLGDYTREEKIEITRRIFDRMKIKVEADALGEIAKRSRNIRAISETSKMLIDRLNLNRKSESIRGEDALELFSDLGVDEFGCDDQDRAALAYLSTAGNASIKSLAAFTHMPPLDFAEKVEPFLIRNQFLIITPKGRAITDLGRRVIGKTPVVEAVEIYGEIR